MDHNKQWQFLTKAAGLGKLPHALLFYGQEKLGKKELAVKFAEHLVGLNNRADFISIESPSIAQVRELIQKLSFKPYSAEHKVAVISQAHLMTREAQNCFLKFLEEPTDKTLLILVTEYPSTLLPTILSRVQKIRFFPLKGFKIDDSEEIVSDLVKLKESDLAYKFQYAKKITAKDSTADIKEILNTWLRCFRTQLISDNTSKTKEILKQIQSTQQLLSTTNTNPKLALEILLLKF
ncbi:hypothetical protein KKC65_00265 [Patescibacteria group bacterium]|nr:hypothetical protein [Patescibacteria group bacterium]